MDPVRRQYEAFPYPQRDPADEARRLIIGSPSHPQEIDHFLFRGRRDWSRPFRALVAGGGTGDGLVMLAQLLSDAGCPAEITYVDLSEASRAVAEARAKARGLTVRFLTGDLEQAPALAAEHGPFDYIDCCGVLHHLPEPQRGFQALSDALAEDGGLGFMVYAPYGRTGVYPLQEAFRALFAEDAPAEKVRLARAALGALPETNWFAANRLLTDHEESDAGLHDLLLHDRDRPYTVGELTGSLEAAGLALVSFVEPARYDPARLLPDAPEFKARLKPLSQAERWALGERLAGDLRVHVGYAAKAPRAAKAMASLAPDAVPRLSVDPRALARRIEQEGSVRVTFKTRPIDVAIPKSAAPLIARLGSGAAFGEIAQAAGMDWLAFAQAFGPAWRGLTSVNLLRCSRQLS
ncbi:MAG: class I SAM-dependent methyltransferase [Pseudomonadota bacterium]